MDNIEKILEFWHLMEKPKLVFRAAKLSSGREESIAEHSWRMALMAAIIAPKIRERLDTERVLKMILVHDIGEMSEGDIPSHIHAFNSSIKEKKDRSEEEMMTSIKDEFPEFGKEVFNLWKEYELQETFEAKFVKALDKLDARIQMIDDPNTREFSAEKREQSGILAKKTSELCGIDELLADLDKLSRNEREEKHGF
ncbi:MAG: HD domain-containing protein [Candidatus Colwellbacteria bacterium]|nr:HD domain-containing protein [Candidatus Colwellbacteria bacterium]